ncbi:cold-shock protein [Parapedobacter tibetensis]|uniref:cold-shock protein n=1 Tax=Parapedobacter tibetensis TaxID=2972951 RepID=UPI00214DA14C|nr:cold shock domain-containing protein [Parapedobacter tibetensis]
MLLGKITWFNNDKGFGMLACPFGDEVFVHTKNFRTASGVLSKNQFLFFNKKHDPQRNRSVAIDCRMVSGLDGWAGLVGMLSGDQPTNFLPLLEQAAVQLIKGKNPEAIFDLVAGFFDNGLEEYQFPGYCALVERTIVQYLGEAKGQELMERLVRHFNEHLTMELLFEVWLTRCFRYIGYTAEGDYEIPRDVLEEFSPELGLPELERIRHYSFGEECCAVLALERLEGAVGGAVEEVKEVHAYLEYLGEADRKRWMRQHPDFKIYS